MSENAELTKDRDMLARMYSRAIERFDFLGMGVMQKIADGGSLLAVLHFVGDVLNENDHVDDEALALFERARLAASPSVAVLPDPQPSP